MQDYIYLFIYKCPFPFKETQLLKEREEYIKTVNFLERNDSYYAWRLLEKSVRRIFKKELNDCNPRKLESGKWICDGFSFSITHSGGFVAVCLSNKNVGIDLQKEKTLDFVADGRLCEDEVASIKNLKIREDYEIWTRKEALYKWLDNKTPFNRATWQAFNTIAYNNLFKTTYFDYGDGYRCNRYYLSICSEIIDSSIKVFSNIKEIENIKFN